MNVDPTEVDKIYGSRGVYDLVELLSSLNNFLNI